MLTALAQLHRTGAIDTPTWFEQAIQKGRLALDLESGAYLVRSGGRGRGGNNRYYLHRAGCRKEIRAFSDADAIAQANLSQAHSRAWGRKRRVMGYRDGMARWNGGLQEYVQPGEGIGRSEDSFDPGLVGRNPSHGRLTGHVSQKPQEAEAMFILPDLETELVGRSSHWLALVEDQAALDAMEPGDELRLEFGITGMRGFYTIRRIS